MARSMGVASFGVFFSWMYVLSIITPDLSPASTILISCVSVFIAASLYSRFVWSFRIDSNTVESVKGIIGKNTSSIMIKDIRTINVNQSIIQRMLFVGNIAFSSAGGGGQEVVFSGIANPQKLKDAIKALL
ncbi:MAG: PH domain-containing protein [Mariprofundaceae bacterium]